MTKKIVLFVCWGNIYRSPVAKIFFDREIQKKGLEGKLVSESRGIQGSDNIPPTRHPNFSGYQDEYQAAKPVMDKYDIDLSEQISRPIDKATVEKAAIILAADKKSLKEINSQFPEAKRKTHLLTELIGNPISIEDPDGVTETEKYQIITKEIHDCVTLGFPKLLSLLKIKFDN